MSKRKAVADGLVSFLCLFTALLGILAASLGWLEAVFLAAILALFGAAALAALHAKANASLEHVALAHLLLALTGIALFWLNNPLGAWAWLVYLAIVIAPFLSRLRAPPASRAVEEATAAGAKTANASRHEAAEEGVAKVLELAKSYGGVLTSDVVARELGLRPGRARRLLGSFYARGLAMIIRESSPATFVFPSVLEEFPEPVRIVIAVLAQHPKGIDRERLASETKIPGLNYILGRLREEGIVSYRRALGRYVLSCFVHERGRRRGRRQRG
ncbi:hypothetical protein DRO60_05680 [Candidatus Bathyarchaeota archaeon]|nr:MAG: hypothetical protein DRO60_05680 [Candidatus Bathyarchaeota archaeon]